MCLSTLTTQYNHFKSAVFFHSKVSKGQQGF